VKLAILLIVAVLLGCSGDDPGSQCLDSFRMTLKDPDSGKVFSFAEPLLTYTATNSYGARTQGKALCHKQSDGKWTRHERGELIATLELVKEKLDGFNQCMKNGAKDRKICAGGSIALNRNSDLDLEALKAEARRELGFE